MRPTIQPPPAEPPPVIMPPQGPPAITYRPPAAPPSAAPPARSWRGELLRIVVELPLVFLAVLLAFLVADHRQEEARERRRAELRAALAAEVAEIGRGTAAAHRSIVAILAAHDSAAAAGAPMPLQPMLEELAVRPHLWQTATTSGALDLLDVETVVRLSAFHGSLDAGARRLDELRDLSARQLLPVADAPASTFWMPDGTVRPQYAWYLATLRRLGATSDALSREADSVLVALGDR